MLDSQPLLSVVVPTHNRSEYAISCIESVLRFADPDLQLVVSDTSTDRRLYDLLHADGCSFLNDPRFLYTKVDEPSDLTKNHNHAISLATGAYICLIGDDDCITSAAIDAARWATERGLDVISQTIAANYAWPDFRSRLVGTGHAGRLYVPRSVRPGRWRDSDVDLRIALARALQGTEHLPRCYHGVVRREVLEAIHEQTGAYFHGSSPDMSGAVSLACLVSRYVEVEMPLTIPGASGGSNSGRSAMNTHKGDLSSETQTSTFVDGGWTPGVPRFFSVETVWAHAGLETLAKLRPDLISSFDYARLIALCTLRHPEFADALEIAADQASQLLGVDVRHDIARKLRGERRKRWAYLARRSLVPTAAYGRRYFGHLKTIDDASLRFEKYSCSRNMAFERCD